MSSLVFKLALIGPPGTGKTRVSEQLGALCPGAVIFDTDVWIADEQKLPVSEIFKTKGESFFRQLETNAVQYFSNFKTPPSLILATGGGMVLNPSHREILKQQFKVFYLDTPLEILLERLQVDPTRPLISGSITEKKQKLKELLTERKKMYEETAHFIIPTRGKNVIQIAQEIKECLDE